MQAMKVVDRQCTDMSSLVTIIVNDQVTKLCQAVAKAKFHHSDYC